MYDASCSSKSPQIGRPARKSTENPLIQHGPVLEGGRSVIEYHYKDVLPVMVDAAWLLLDVSEKPELEVVK